MGNTTSIIFVLLLIPTALQHMQSQQFKEREVLSGAEPVVSYGLDSTDNWWAITEAFTERFRLIVNGDETDVFQFMQEPVFSPDGLYWVTFAINENSWELLSNAGDEFLLYNRVEELQFSQDSRIITFVGFEAEEGWLVRYVIKDGDDGYPFLTLLERFPISAKVGKSFISQRGDRMAYIGQRGSGKSVTVNNKEGPLYDEIVPMGFWHDGAFLFAGQLGNSWTIYRDDEAISASFENIPEVAINEYGTAAAFIGMYEGGGYGILISDQDEDPVYSRRYDNVFNLALHPSEAVYAFKAKRFNAFFAVLGNVQYSAENNSGKLFFTYDGSELIFLDCDIVNCYMNVNGKRFDLSADFSVDKKFAVAPGTETFGFVTGLTLVVRKYKGNEIYAGSLVDEISPPRYNWRQQRYEALGKINQRLYMISCTL